MMRRFVAFLPCVCSLPYLPDHLTHGAGGKAQNLGADMAAGSGTLSYLEMPLDHFAEPGGETWNLKYWYNAAAWQEGGVLLLNMPNEGPAYGCSSNGLATSLTAVAVCAQHRFFGDSVLRDSSSVDNLQFHTVEQNLADQIELVNYIKSQYPSISAVVASGGSYAGASSAWIRHRYPDTIDAAIAQSPPIEARVAFPEYDTSNLVALSSPDYRCANTIVKVNEALERQFATNRTALMRLFNAEYLITSDLGDTDFLYGLGDSTAAAVQYGQKENLCKVLSSLYDKSDVCDTHYAQVFADYTFQQNGEDYYSGCFYNSTCIRDSATANPAESARSWYWLKCTQLGYLQVAPQEGLSTRPRAFNTELALAQCAYIFPGAVLISDASVKDFNEKYGGETVGGTSQIFEVDYSDDPWKMLTSVSVIQRKEWSLSLEQPLLYLTCDNCGHCGSGVSSSKWQAVKAQMVAALKSWGISGAGGSNLFV